MPYLCGIDKILYAQAYLLRKQKTKIFGTKAKYMKNKRLMVLGSLSSYPIICVSITNQNSYILC